MTERRPRCQPWGVYLEGRATGAEGGGGGAKGWNECPGSEEAGRVSGIPW